MFQLNLKRFLPLIALTIFLASCSGSKNVTKASHSAIEGTWTLDRITYDGLEKGEKVKLTLLDEGFDGCLTGSTWVLPFNGYGSYTLISNAGGCTAGERKINWSYQKSGDQSYFQFKRLQEGVKAKNISDGYRLKVTEISKTTMSLQSEVAFEGKSIFINYSFLKK